MLPVVRASPPVGRPLPRSVGALSALALVAAAPAQEPGGIPLATNKEEAVAARLFETEASIRIEVTGPIFVVPLVAIDADRNGKVDPEVDFLVSYADGSPCLSRLLREGMSSPCRPLEDNAQLTKVQSGQTITTNFLFPKRAISADGFGFGFAIRLWNEEGHYATPLAAGDYRFGGPLQLVTNHVNFMGESLAQPGPIMPAVHRYEGCLDRGITALGALQPAKLNALKEVPTACRAIRAEAMNEAAAALVAAGAQKPDAESYVRELFDGIDAGVARLVHVLEAGPPKK